ncbi:MAG: MoxR family ATPase [Deltaproteobacteria bacterium]|nr:MoxR family ATPase [Deltaproteobacteria bacterium]
MQDRETKSQEQIYSAVQAVAEEINKVIVGQEWLIQRLLIGLFSEIPYSFRRDGDEKSGYGHVLLEGVPGLAKTLTVMTLANTISAKFQRIQFTPDLLPADIIGTRIFDTALSSFRTEKGPIFANLILADEINRASQKTQSALLEAMQERQVTIGETTYPLEEPFWVLATQNPVEQEGVYALPEAQVDRFSLKVKVDYPSHADEAAMLARNLSAVTVQSIMTPADVIRQRRDSRVRHPYRARHAQRFADELDLDQRNGAARRLAARGTASACPSAHDGLLRRTGLRAAGRRQADRARCPAPPFDPHRARRSGEYFAG